jgi:hypothetical protein
LYHRKDEQLHFAAPLVVVAHGLDLLLASAGGEIGDEVRMAAGRLNPQFMIVLQKHDRANLSESEGGKIVKNETILENNMRIQGIMTKLTCDFRSQPIKVINVILVSGIFLRNVSQKWMETV